MLDLLNNEDAFFPLEAETTSSIRLVHKRNIFFITTHEDKEENESGKPVTVTIVRTDGEKLGRRSYHPRAGAPNRGYSIFSTVTMVRFSGCRPRKRFTTSIVDMSVKYCPKKVGEQ